MANHSAHRNNHRKHSIPDGQSLIAHLRAIHEQLEANSIVAPTSTVQNWVLSQDPITGHLLAKWVPSGTVTTVALADTPPPVPALRPGTSRTRSGALDADYELLERVRSLPSSL